MSLLDFFKKKPKSDKSDGFKIDLTDFKFVANAHYRFEDGIQVGGNNFGAVRGIRIEKNNSDEEKCIVTIYNVDSKHPIWGDNIQMAPKAMKIIEKNNEKIFLRGYGYDSNGGDFSDYGVTLFIHENTVDKIRLHLFDRNIEITYFEYEENDQIEINNPDNKISTNSLEIIGIIQSIQSTNNISDLEELFMKYINYNHPQIPYEFAIAFLRRKHKVLAKIALIRGASFGIKYPCEIYDNPLVDSIGQCLAYLVIYFSPDDELECLKVTELAYLYLSRCIELLPREAHDSYRTRGLLFAEHEGPTIPMKMLKNNFEGIIPNEPFTISDYFFASQASSSPFRALYQRAKELHNGIENISIFGKNATNYSLPELAIAVESIHLELFKKIENRYKNRELEMNSLNLASAVSY